MDDGRRRLLKLATAGLGGAVAAVVGVPIAGYFAHPVGRRTVKSSGEPADVIGLDDLEAEAAPLRVKIIAREVRDGWTVIRDVPLGAAWLIKSRAGEVSAFSATCPHLGCSVQFDAAKAEYNCPCHKSAFALDGARKSGPSKRGLDPLPVTVTEGRVLVTWIQYKPDIARRERA